MGGLGSNSMPNRRHKERLNISKKWITTLNQWIDKQQSSNSNNNNNNKSNSDNVNVNKSDKKDFNAKTLLTLTSGDHPSDLINLYSLLLTDDSADWKKQNLYLSKIGKLVGCTLIDITYM